MSQNKTKYTLMAASGIACVIMMIPLQSFAEDKAKDEKETKSDEAVLVVKGIRKSMENSADKKRKSAQITETITAEDAGKLPDNNVVEALAHVTGVQITRARGEGESLMIRGMSDVQTTLNGAPNSTGVSRAASLNDLPAELIKSVTVYKTRTADQAEGGIAGTVNVDLRRPLDLRRGWTVAGSLRKVYGSVGDTESPYGSALIANRFDTPYGEMGLLLNLSYQENNYNEQFVQSETPALFWCCGTQWNSIPHQSTDVSIYRAQYGVEYGKVRRPSLNLSYQWRINDNLDIVLEGSSFQSKENRSYSALNTRIKDSPGVLSNVKYGPDGRTIVAMTVTDPNTADTDFLPVGPTSRDDTNIANNERINFEAHWHNEVTTINFAAYQDKNAFKNSWMTQTLRLNGLTGFTIDMNSPNVPGGGPFVTYSGASPSSASAYRLKEFEDGKGFENSTESAVSLDITRKLSETNFFREVKFGTRISKRDFDRAYGYRYAGWVNPVALTGVPGATLEKVTPEVDGSSGLPSWYRISRKSLVENYTAFRNYLYNNSIYSGGSGNFSTPIVDTEKLLGSFDGSEKVSAVYAQFGYGFKLFGYDVDGLLGTRVAHTWATSTTTNLKITSSGEQQVVVKQEGGGTDVMPNATAIMHFSDKQQLRFGYSVNIQRPNLTDNSSFVFYDTNGCNCGWGGNPELRPNKEASYDLSYEYYFGKGGVVSVSTYYKKPDGFIIWGTSPQDFNGVTYTIARPVNAAGGEFQGYEFNAQGFFDFLPAPWDKFGGQVNATYNAKAKIYYEYYNGSPVTDWDKANIPGLFDAPNNSKSTYNLALYYEGSQFSARVAYNYRSKWRANLDGYAMLGYSTYFKPTSRLDAALNWTLSKHLTLSLEGTNLLEDRTGFYYGANNLLPAGVRVGARTVQVSARFRY